MDLVGSFFTKYAARSSSLSPEVGSLLNEQVGHEIHNAQSYLAASSWCMDNGFLNSATFFKKQAAEEREHQLRVIKYIEDRSGIVNVQSIPEPAIKVASVRSLMDIYQQAYQLEQSTTRQLEAITKAARAQDDFITDAWLTDMLKEQIQEENDAADRIAMLKAASGNMAAEFLFDQLSMKQYI